MFIQFSDVHAKDKPLQYFQKLRITEIAIGYSVKSMMLQPTHIARLKASHNQYIHVVWKTGMFLVRKPQSC